MLIVAADREMYIFGFDLLLAYYKLICVIAFTYSIPMDVDFISLFLLRLLVKYHPLNRNSLTIGV